MFVSIFWATSWILLKQYYSSRPHCLWVNNPFSLRPHGTIWAQGILLLNILLHCIIWLHQWAGNLKQILCCAWLPKRARWESCCLLGISCTGPQAKCNMATKRALVFTIAGAWYTKWIKSSWVTSQRTWQWSLARTQ